MSTSKAFWDKSADNYDKTEERSKVRKPVGSMLGGITGANDYTSWLSGDPEMAGTYGSYDGPYPPWNDALVHQHNCPRRYSTNARHVRLMRGPASSIFLMP